MKLPINQIVSGNCIEVMKEFPDNSIDCIVTDPPYGIGFMGKKWDKALPPKEAFQEMFRVLKPGALAFIMSSPRQDVLWRMLKMLEECGFQLKQSFISWIYKTGFPKAYDISLGIDTKFIREEFISEHRRKPTREELKKLVKEKRKVIGKRTSGKPETHTSYNMANMGSSAMGGEYDITESASDLAKKWNGWKSITGLKPALECILMVNKPLSEKTIVDNVLRYGVGAINVDACRIPFKNNGWSYPKGAGGLYSKEYQEKSKIAKDWHKFSTTEDNKPVSANQKGRFPANLLVSDKALDTGKITKSTGKTRLRHNIGFHSDNPIYGHGNGTSVCPEYGDVGGASRFFDLDAWAKHHGFLDVPKASKSERNKGLKKLIPKEKTDTFNKSNHEHKEFIDRLYGQKKRLNYHPTVKPIKLMAYLIELGCPKGGIILDPFVGSGTICIAAERLRRKWIGIELNKEYVTIAKKRLMSECSTKITEWI